MTKKEWNRIRKEFFAGDNVIIEYFYGGEIVKKVVGIANLNYNGLSVFPDEGFPNRIFISKERLRSIGYVNR